MGKKESMWEDELKNGWPSLLDSRLAFHGALYVDQVVETTKRSASTVRRHFKRHVENGKAVWLPQRSGITSPERAAARHAA